MGKGSAPRPFSVSNEEYEKRWEAIFGTDIREEKKVSSYQYLENEVEIWGFARGILVNGKPLGQAEKTVEEAAELLKAVAEGDREGIIDGIGDVLVTLIMQASLQNVTVTECLQHAYDQIKDRKGYLNENGVFIKDE